MFFEKCFINNPFLITSNADNVIGRVNGWDKKSQIKGDLSGSELIVLVKMNSTTDTNDYL